MIDFNIFSQYKMIILVAAGFDLGDQLLIVNVTMFTVSLGAVVMGEGGDQCDQKKIAKCL